MAFNQEWSWRKITRKKKEIIVIIKYLVGYKEKSAKNFNLLSCVKRVNLMTLFLKAALISAKLLIVVHWFLAKIMHLLSQPAH